MIYDNPSFLKKLIVMCVMFQKNDMHAKLRSDMHANPKNEMHANPKNDMYANPKSDIHDI